MSWIDELLDTAEAAADEKVHEEGAAGSASEGDWSLATRISTAVDQLAERAVLQRLSTLSTQLEEKGF